MAKTFKELQDEVLQWGADEADTGLLRDLSKQALDKAQRKILASEQLDFMLSPVMTLTSVVGQKVYPLPDNYLSLLYVRDGTTGEFLEEIPSKGVLEADQGVDASDANDGTMRYSLGGLSGVRMQPSASGVVVVTPTGGSEAAANGVVVQGLDSSGNWVEEALTSGSSWASLTTTNSFAQITNVIKTGDTWTRTIVVTVGTVTVLTLKATEFSKQFQLLELANTPTVAKDYTYRYYLKPTDLVYDHQTPQIPEAYRDVLVYDALLALTGYLRSTPDELGNWLSQRTELLSQLKQNYQQARTLGARARRVLMVPRI